MKKFVLLFACVFAGYSLFAQVKNTTNSAIPFEKTEKKIPNFKPSTSAPSYYLGGASKVAVLTEGFEGGALPAGWTEELVTGTLNWTYVNGGGTPAAAHTGSFNARFYSSTYSATKLVTPTMDLSALTSPVVKFWHTQGFWSPDQDTLKVYYKTSTAGTWTLLQTYSSDIPAWTEETLVLPSPSADYYIAFQGVADWGYGVCLDDISVLEPLTTDAQTSSIDFGNSLSGSIAPLATYKNNGSSAATFNVTMTINPGAYTSTQAITALASNGTQQVTFTPSWTATPGTYTVKTWTSLTGDLDHTNDTLTKTVTIIQAPAHHKVFAYNAYDPTSTIPQGPGYFYLDAPSVFTSLATDAGNFWSGGAFGNGKWFATVYTDNNLITVDTVTGAATVVGALGVDINGLTFDPTTNTLYGVSYTTSPGLYTIDQTTGVATLVGLFTGTPLMINLACNSTGQLFACDIVSDVLYSINKTTGAETAVGPLGIAISYAQSMECDLYTDEFFMQAYTTTGELLALDVVTGTATSLGILAGGAEIDGSAMPYNVILSVNENINENNTVIFPSPATTVVNVLSKFNVERASIINTVGQTIRTITPNSTNFDVNVANIETGIYFIRLESGDNSVTKRFQIVR